MSKRNYHRLSQDPWVWKPVTPETAEEKADRKRREAIAAERRAQISRDDEYEHQDKLEAMGVDV